jgi:adenosylmethionine-8-amino-7-oxononanoate aminotransferase
VTSPAEPTPPSGRTARTEDLVARDLRNLWHPFTQHSVWPDDGPLVVDRADGMYFWDTDGNRYLDGVSSLWVTVHGHGVPEIDAAVRAQLERLDHTTFLGLSHQPGIELAERLLATAPAGLTRVFYAGDGSSAVEAAIKMAFQAQAQRADGGPAKPLYLHVAEGYHGDTRARSASAASSCSTRRTGRSCSTPGPCRPQVCCPRAGPRCAGPPRCSPRCAGRSRTRPARSARS